MSKNDMMSRMIYDSSFDLLFHKVKIAPASHVAISYYKDTLLLHLPGLPLSSFLGFELLGIPALRQLKFEKYRKKEAILTKNKDEFYTKDNCISAVPGYFNGKNFKSAPSFGAGMLNALSKCNGFVEMQNSESRYFCTNKLPVQKLRCKIFCPYINPTRMWNSL